VFSENLINLLQARLHESKIQLEDVIAPALDKLLIDQYLLEQVFINLFTNAIEALEQQVHPRIEFRVQKDLQRIRFSIKDNGPGISDEILSQIFVPFFTSKENGSGIGLSISRQIVQAHSGRLFVHTKEGQGATFFVELPSPEKLP